jgi:hypothetical protein
MAINERVRLTWKGEEYSILMTMRVIEEIEEHINLSKMVMNCSKGDLKVSHASRLIAIILEKSGCVVSSDEIWNEVFSGGDVDPVEMTNMVTLILGAIFPPPKKKSSTLAKKPTD